jgi:HK97 family phage portal protein
MGRGRYQEWIHNPDRPDIFHLHINSDDGLDGRSPLQINRESLGITLAAEQYVGAWFGNGAIPGMVLTHPGRLKDGAKENLRKQWLEKFMGASKANKLAILEEGVAVTVVGVDPERSQLDKLRAAQVEAAARIYRVPLFLIQNQTKDTSWGSGIEQQMLGFVNLTMMPWLQQWQQAIARDLLSRQSFYTHEALFVVNSLVRGDLKTRVEAYASARQNGWLDGNEIRELEDLNPRSGADVLWMPTNMVPAGLTGSPAIVEPDPAPTPTSQAVN